MLGVTARRDALETRAAARAALLEALAGVEQGALSRRPPGSAGPAEPAEPGAILLLSVLVVGLAGGTRRLTHEGRN